VANEDAVRRLLHDLLELIEGRDTRLWKPWWRERKTIAEASLSRADYLRLKTSALRGGAEVLEKHGVAFEWSPHASNVMRMSAYHDDVTDDDGHPLPSLRPSVYGGTFTALDEGDADEAFRVLLAFVRAEIPLETFEGGQELGELVSDFAFDAEEKGPECLRVVARVFDVLPKGEWLDPAIEHLHEELERYGAGDSDPT